MAWIKSLQQLERHPKILRLRDMLGVPLDTVLGIVHRFWWWSLDYAENGALDKYGIETISRVLGIDANFLIQAGLIDTKPYLRIHDWWHYTGSFFKVKYKNYPSKWGSIQKAYEEQVEGFPNTPPKGNPKPVKIRKDKKRKDISIRDEDFDEFWRLYPKRIGKGSAEKAWFKLDLSNGLKEKIFGALAAHLKSQQWLKENGKYIPNPEKWLRDRRWEDEIQVEGDPYANLR